MQADKKIISFVKKLLALSLDEAGVVSAERVDAVLASLRKSPPHGYRQVLRAYAVAVKNEVKKSQAVVEHAGALSEEAVAAIQTQLSNLYQRSITVATQETPALIGGVRVRIADDVYDSSLAGKLQALASKVN